MAINRFSAEGERAAWLADLATVAGEQDARDAALMVNLARDTRSYTGMAHDTAVHHYVCAFIGLGAEGSQS